MTKPGSYTMNPRVNVLQALSIAGGMTPFAATNDIMVLRGTGNAQHAVPFRYGEVMKGRNINQNVVLEPGDVVDPFPNAVLRNLAWALCATMLCALPATRGAWAQEIVFVPPGSVTAESRNQQNPRDAACTR